MNNLISNAQKIKNPLEIIIRRIVKQETKNCLRLYKARVITAASGNVMQVKLIADDKTLTLPYSSKCSSATVNSIVWVATLTDSFRNAIVWETYNLR